MTRRRKVTADSLVWMFHDRIRVRFKNLKSAPLAIIPEGRHGWTVLVKKRQGSNPDLVAFVRTLEAELRRSYDLED